MKRAHWIILITLGLAVLVTSGCATHAHWPAINDETAAVHTPGRWVWAELFTKDVAAAGEFYAKVFDWEINDEGLGRDDYLLISANGRPIAGIVRYASTRDEDRSAQWLQLMSVPNVTRGAADATDAGGEIVLDPRRLDGRGEVAVIADPEGALFGIIHSDSGDPPDTFPPANTWLWHELWAMDVTRMADFYRGIGSYEVNAPSSGKGIGDERPEVYLAAQGYPRAGIVEQQRDDLPSAWLPYVRVTDLRGTLDRVTEGGGEVLLEPSPDVRGGRVAVFTDPQGAAVGIATWPDGEAGKE